MVCKPTRTDLSHFPCFRSRSEARLKLAPMVNKPVNVPAVRKVAERPASATWRCGQIAAPGCQASPGIAPQVTSSPRLPLTRLSWYTPPVNVPATRTVASRLSSVKWRYNAGLWASPKIGPQVAHTSCRSPASCIIILSNVSVVWKVPKRPASATWRCGQIAASGFQASTGIGPQVTPLVSLFAVLLP